MVWINIGVQNVEQQFPMQSVDRIYEHLRPTTVLSLEMAGLCSLVILHDRVSELDA